MVTSWAMGGIWRDGEDRRLIDGAKDKDTAGMYFKERMGGKEGERLARILKPQ